MKKIKNIFKLKSVWMDLYCDIWTSNGKDEIEYWRIKKPDSIIVITIYKDCFVLPNPQFRPGVNKKTLDFPGGRQQTSDSNNDAREIIIRELNINKEDVSEINRLRDTNYIVNSSFNTQKVIFYFAKMKKLPEEKSKYIEYPVSEGAKLLDELECLQCAFGLLVYLNSNK